MFTLLILSFVPIQSSATSWAYPFVVWDGYMYEVKDESVSEIGNEIGHVTRYSDMKTLSGNFSNAYKKGTKYFSIQGISTNEAIAIEVEDGIYKKALRVGEYTGGSEDNFTLAVIGLISFVSISFILLYFINKRSSK